jgi:hypothetical protein
MNVINEALSPGSDINTYVDNMERIYKQEMEKIHFMMTRLQNFKQLLREEQMIADKFAKAHEQHYSMQTSLLNEEVNILEDDF